MNTKETETERDRGDKVVMVKEEEEDKKEEEKEEEEEEEEVFPQNTRKNPQFPCVSFVEISQGFSFLEGPCVCPGVREARWSPSRV